MLHTNLGPFWPAQQLTQPSDFILSNLRAKHFAGTSAPQPRRSLRERWQGHDLLALFLIVVAPVWDHFATQRLKASKESRVKIAYYRAMVITGWIATLIAPVTVGWRAILTFDAGASSPSCLP
jgi:hypothetical protein